MIGKPLGPLSAATDEAIRLLRAARSAEEAARPVLEQLARAIHCDWGVYWTRDPLLRQLQAVASWSTLGEHGQRFEQDTRVRTLAPHAGNAGQVWHTRRLIWATDLTMEMCMPRCLRAVEAGLRAGVWFAVQTDTAVYGVIELLARVPPDGTPATLVALERTGFRLGYALEELRVAPPASPLH
jgi:hypothetical protein